MTTAARPATLEKVAKTFKRKERIIVIGVLNVTPDSFSDDGQFDSVDQAVRRCLQMVAEGADIIDIGGESSRPGAVPVTEQEELRRVMPVIEKVVESCSVPISIDTCKAVVAEAALHAGAAIVNDISGLENDPDLAPVVARSNAGLVVMHKRGTSQTMQNDTHYDDLIGEIISYLDNAVAMAERAGVDPDKIIIDPGIGFGKDVTGNLELIKSIDGFCQLGKPVLVGASRKSFIGRITGAAVNDRLPGSLAAAAIAVIYGAAAVRAHDVAATRQAVDLAIRLR
ncbi:MAG: dihydropteroate synthase [candidate division Zixibacteria bacterium]|nr:dihydropteroate synthase [candidate division Zixibacteria bacterium]